VANGDKAFHDIVPDKTGVFVNPAVSAYNEPEFTLSKNVVFVIGVRGAVGGVKLLV
jgi:hypothetical protein